MTPNSHHLFTHYILCFRCLTIGRELSEIPANQAKFAPFAHKFHELCAFCTKIHPHLVHYFQISDHRQNPRKLERINQISRSSTTAPTNYVKFAESAPMTSYLGVNPENSRNIQQTTQVLRLSHNASANHAKFLTFANKTQDKFPFLAHFAHVLLHMCCIYAHILHYCRLVLNTKFYHVNHILH